MSCLFGDATETDLDPNYLQFLRDFVGFAVEVLLAEERVDEVRDLAVAAEATTALERRKLHALQARLTKALRIGSNRDGGVAERCTEAIERACEGVIGDEIAHLEQELESERLEADRARSARGRSCERALQRLLLVPHNLPGSRDELVIEHIDDLGYRATLQSRTPYGLAVELDLDIAEGCLFGSVVRVAQVAPTLEVHVPEARGWLSKKIKLVRHKLAKHLVHRVRIHESRVDVSLRHPDSGAGFDILLDSDWSAPRVVAVHGDDPPDLLTAHDVDERDQKAVSALLTTVVEAAEAIRAEPAALTRATLDDQPLSALPDPCQIVDRLIETVAPVVRAIGEHSLGSRELVLKRKIGEDRREEIYLPRSELLQKISALTPQNQARFAPLALRQGAPPIPRQPKEPAVVAAPALRRVPSRSASHG